MPLIKSRKKKDQSKNIETEMEAGKPQKQAIAISYDIMRRARKNKKAQGGLSNPEHEKSVSEMKISEHFPTYDNREQEDPQGLSSTDEQKKNEHSKIVRNSSNTDLEDESLQQHMKSRPNDKEDRGHVLFDGDAERKDPLQLEMREDLQSDHLGRRELDEEDSDADDIVSRIMRKMRRK